MEGPSGMFLVGLMLVLVLGQSVEAQKVGSQAPIVEDAAEWNANDYMKREHSLVKPYQGAGFGIPNWDFMGSTIVTGSHVRLTADTRSQQGSLWNRLPVYMRNWELQVQFKVTGSTKDLFGDGFAVWYTRERMEPGPVFGSKDHFSGIAIMADTYSNHNGPHNHQHPYLSAMINNGSLHYDHDKDGTHTMIGGCETKFRNLAHDTSIAIRYENDVLTVSHDIGNKRAWEQCFRVEDVKLPTGYYFGITATTGELSDSHDVISIRTFELQATPEQLKEDRSRIEPSSAFVQSPREHVEDTKPSSSWSGIKTFFVILFSVIGCVVLVIVGVMWYQKQQENSRKRFY